MALCDLALLASLYLAQGLPYGFFTRALPVMLRKDGVSLAIIGASAVLALPWGLKFLWAPLVDRCSGSPLGPRRGWIVPLQLATILVALALAMSRDVFAGASLIVLLSAGVVVMNCVDRSHTPVSKRRRIRPPLRDRPPGRREHAHEGSSPERLPVDHSGAFQGGGR